MAEQTVEIKDVMSAVGDLRESVKKYGIESAEHKEKAEKIEKFLDKFEEEKQAVLLENEQKKKEAEELKERMEVLELELAKTGETKSVEPTDTFEYKSLNKYVRFGENSLEADEYKCLKEQKTLRMDDNTTGGFLTTVQIEPSIIKKQTEFSNMRSVARVKTVDKKSLEIPARAGIPVSTYEGEAQTGNLSQSSYGSEGLTAYRLTVTVPFTLDLLNDANFDILTEINSDVAESNAQKEGNKFVLGSGVKEPEGFLSNAAAIANPVITSGVGAISYKDLTKLTGELKTSYNPMYAFTRKTLAALRSLEDTAGNPVWQTGLAAVAPNMINGQKYIILPDMPEIVSNNLAVMYADFGRGYLIVDRTGMSIIRDDVTSKRAAIVEITFHRWNTGKVILPEAFKALKVQ